LFLNGALGAAFFRLSLDERETMWCADLNTHWGVDAPMPEGSVQTSIRRDFVH